MDDIEAMLEVNREQLGFIPEEKGGEIAGKLVVIDKDSQNLLEKSLNVKFENCIAKRHGIIMRKEIVPLIKSFLETKK